MRMLFAVGVLSLVVLTPAWAGGREPQAAVDLRPAARSNFSKGALEFEDVSGAFFFLLVLKSKFYISND